MYFLAYNTLPDNKLHLVFGRQKEGEKMVPQSLSVIA